MKHEKNSIIFFSKVILLKLIITHILPDSWYRQFILIIILSTNIYWEPTMYQALLNVLGKMSEQNRPAWKKVIFRKTKTFVSLDHLIPDLVFVGFTFEMGSIRILFCKSYKSVYSPNLIYVEFEMSLLFLLFKALLFLLPEKILCTWESLLHMNHTFFT